MKIYVNGKSLVDFGSAGQQRSGLLSLYFAQMEIHRETHGFYPIFLMDDAEAEFVVSRGPDRRGNSRGWGADTARSVTVDQPWP